MNDEETLQRSRRAASEYRETEQAFADLRDAILQKLVGTSPTQPEVILKLHMAVQNLTAVQTALMHVVQNGHVAERALELAQVARPH